MLSMTVIDFTAILQSRYYHDDINHTGKSLGEKMISIEWRSKVGERNTLKLICNLRTHPRILRKRVRYRYSRWGSGNRISTWSSLPADPLIFHGRESRPASFQVGSDEARIRAKRNKENKKGKKREKKFA